MNEVEKKILKDKMSNKLDGCFNPSADRVKRVDETWSDTNLTEIFPDNHAPFPRLKCRNCGSLEFEVLGTDVYETSARCRKCGMYYIVHTG